jgi:SPP1 gp7 family putative phage head morphogenesis protein
VFNQSAVDYLDVYHLTTIPGITDTLQKQSIDIIQKWIRGGEPLPALVQRLTPVFGEARAERIAVTEVTRTYASGNLAAWKSTGLVTGKMWATAEDEKVCPICGPLDGKVVEIDGDFTPDEIPADWGNPSDFVYTQPPAHVNCRCWLKPVTTEAALRQKIRGILNQ